MKFKITLVLLSVLILTSCSPENDDYLTTDSTDFIIEIGSGSTDVPTNSTFQTELTAGQNIYSGFVSVDVHDGNVIVTYTSESDWEIIETHLYIGELNQLPTNGNGDPRIGQFPYKDTHPAATTIVEYIGPGINSGDCVYIAAHAVVVNSVTGDEETAWGAGVPIGGDSWAMTFEYCY